MDTTTMACDDCGSRFYRSELPTGATFEDKLQVHKEMGCNLIGDPPRLL
jgi:ribosomal protein L33